jgi:hypothetical protein
LGDVDVQLLLGDRAVASEENLFVFVKKKRGYFVKNKKKKS